MGIQDFGANFDLDKFYRARDMAQKMTHELSSHIKAGMTEVEAHGLYKNLCTQFGIEKNWHPPKIRFGPNTLKTFKEISEPYVLQENDLYFIDIGPVIDGHEADYGETFTLGENAEYKHIAEAAKIIFHEVSDYWRKQKSRGPALYEFASERARILGYQLNLGSDGHRIGDFPHHLFFKGAIIECEESLLPNAWILEIQLNSIHQKFGAFFEDILM